MLHKLRTWRVAAAARVRVAVLAALRRLAADQAVEVALLAVGRGVLVDERESVRVEVLEPLVPRDLLERRVVVLRRVGEGEADDPRVLRGVVGPGPPHARRPGAARLRPTLDLVVVDRGAAV